MQLKSINVLQDFPPIARKNMELLSFFPQSYPDWNISSGTPAEARGSSVNPSDSHVSPFPAASSAPLTADLPWSSVCSEMKSLCLSPGHMGLCGVNMSLKIPAECKLSPVQWDLPHFSTFSLYYQSLTKQTVPGKALGLVTSYFLRWK